MNSETLAVPVAATCATITSTIAGYPFDTVKTKMQVGNYKSSFNCLKITISNEGIQGLYRGALPVMISTSFFRSLTFSLYHNAKNWISVNSNGNHPSFKYIYAGVFSGSIVSIISAPLEFIKVLRQTESLHNHLESRNLGFWGWIKHVYLKKGIFGFYSGANLQLLRDSTGTAIYFYAYEKCKVNFQEKHGQDKKIPWWALSLSGGFAGSAVWITLFPVDL